MANKHLWTVLSSPLLLQDRNTWVACSSHIPLRLYQFMSLQRKIFLQLQIHFCLNIKHAILQKHLTQIKAESSCCSSKIILPAIYHRGIENSHKAPLEKKRNLMFFRLFPSFRSSTLKIQSLNNIIACCSSEKDFMSDRLLLNQLALKPLLISHQYSASYLWTLQTIAESNPQKEPEVKNRNSSTQTNQEYKGIPKALS